MSHAACDLSWHRTLATVSAEQPASHRRRPKMSLGSISLTAHVSRPSQPPRACLRRSFLGHRGQRALLLAELDPRTASAVDSPT
jgi:hypothetical protein